MSNRLDELVQLLTKEGAKVQPALPDIDLESYFADYTRLLFVMNSLGAPKAVRTEMAKGNRAAGSAINDAMADGLEMDAADFIALLRRRESARVAWRNFFNDWDVVIAPMVLDSAFPHQEGNQDDRTLTIDNRSVPYYNNIAFPMLAIFPGLPSTAFPAGLDSQGLPLGLQAIGPYLEDRTTLRFAQLLERAFYRFEPQPGY